MKRGAVFGAPAAPWATSVTSPSARRLLSVIPANATRNFMTLHGGTNGTVVGTTAEYVWNPVHGRGTSLSSMLARPIARSANWCEALDCTRSSISMRPTDAPLEWFISAKRSVGNAGRLASPGAAISSWPGVLITFDWSGASDVTGYYGDGRCYRADAVRIPRRPAGSLAESLRDRSPEPRLRNGASRHRRGSPA
jgi:hypothetical protein